MSSNEELPPYFLVRSWFVFFFSMTGLDAKSVPERSVALDVNELLQDVLDLNEVARVIHDFIDVLVRRRDLVEQHLRMPVLDACHRAAEVVHAEECARFRPRIAAPGTVRSGVKAHRMFLADNDVTPRAHRAGYHRPVVSAGLDCPFAGDPDPGSEVLLL